MEGFYPSIDGPSWAQDFLRDQQLAKEEQAERPAPTLSRGEFEERLRDPDVQETLRRADSLESALSGNLEGTVRWDDELQEFRAMRHDDRTDSDPVREEGIE